MGNLVIVTFWLLLAFAWAVWWWTGPSSDELVVYRAKCTNEVSILPPSLTRRGTGCRQPGVVALAADDAEAEQVPVKGERALKVGDLQVYRLDGGRGRKSGRVHRVGSRERSVARRATREKSATERTVVAAPVRKTLS